MIFKKCKYALKYTKNHFEIYRTVLNISQKYKKIDFPRNKNYKNAQTIPRLKAGLGIRGLISLRIELVSLASSKAGWFILLYHKFNIKH